MMAKGDVKIAIIGDASSLVSAFGKAGAAGSAFSGVFAGVIEYQPVLVHFGSEPRHPFAALLQQRQHRLAVLTEQLGCEGGGFRAVTEVLEHFGSVTENVGHGTHLALGVPGRDTERRHCLRGVLEPGPASR